MVAGRRQRVVEEDQVLSPAVAQAIRAEEERAEIANEQTYDVPVVYYNPICVHESYRLPGTSYFRRFAAGRVEVETPSHEKMVRAVLAAYGVGKPDRWRGNNRGSEESPKFWQCKKCTFVCANDEAIEDHRETFNH